MDTQASLSLIVTVSGTPTDDDDQGVPGSYEVAARLQRPVEPSALSAPEAGALAEAALDAFHERIGIAELDDFSIAVTVKNGPDLIEMESADDHADDLVAGAEFVGKLD